jgi:hypothetical protein
MIGIRSEGRLGNQLFQYAFIFSASKKLNTGFYIDQFTERSYVHQYFQIDKNTTEGLSLFLANIKGYRNIFSYQLRKSLNKYISGFYKLKVKQYPFAGDEAEVVYEDNTLYIGYFQSLLFMNNYESEIREKLCIKDVYTTTFKNKYDTLYSNNTIVTIHIRRTDYKNLQHLNLGANDLTLPLSYYQNTLTALKRKNLHYIFISDDIAFIEENFADIEPKTISKESEIYDFQHLLNSNICVISNSTFSWWGAWLNTRSDKIIYCPKYYLGYHLKKQIPENIYPQEWRQIEFDQ